MDLMTQTEKRINLLPPKDISSSAHSAAYVNMKLYRHVDFVVQVGANGAGTKAVTIYEAKNTSGSSATALTGISHYYGNTTALASSSIGNDILAQGSLSSGAFSIAASTDNQLYVIPVDADDLNRSSSMTHVGIGIAASAAACIVGVIAEAKASRYMQDVPPTAMD